MGVNLVHNTFKSVFIIILSKFLPVVTNILIFTVVYRALKYFALHSLGLHPVPLFITHFNDLQQTHQKSFRHLNAVNYTSDD